VKSLWRYPFSWVHNEAVIYSGLCGVTVDGLVSGGGSLMIVIGAALLS
jgi:hypothetical protein